jgi:hypothetical protein
MAPCTILGLDCGHTQPFSALDAEGESGQDTQGPSVWAVHTKAAPCERKSR